MKTKELMIGDWVAIGSESFKHYGIVKSIDVSDVYVMSLLTGNTERHLVSCLDHILLSTEILEKNGWRNIDNIYFSLESRFNNGKKASCGNYIHYVHELQHIWRLCGRNDLADNFVV